MSVAVLLPRTGSTSSDVVTVVEWRVGPGDAVEVDDVVAEVETDKSTVEIVSTASGTVLELCVEELGELSIGEPLLYVGTSGEVTVGDATKNAPEASPPSAGRAADPFANAAAPPPPPPPAASTPSPPDVATTSTPVVAPSPGPVRATPAARRVARERGLDLTAAVVGTGPDGRIEQRDVEVVAPVPAARSSADVPDWADGLRGARRAIALRMAESHAAVVPVTLHRDLDLTSLVRWSDHRSGGAPVLDTVLVAIARVVARHPGANAHLGPAGIESFDAVHLGYAVDGGRGLIVPSIRDAHSLTVGELRDVRRSLVERALEGRLDPATTEGATFTVSNLGPFGVDHFTPVVNLPQVAILGLGAMRTKVDADDDDQVVIRRVIGASLTFDHRAIDGAAAARLLDDLARVLTEPFELLC